MAVVVFPNIDAQGFSHELRPNVSAVRSRFTGAAWRISRGGDHWAMTISYRNLSGQDRAVIKSVVDALRGGVNSAYVRVPGYVRRGSGIGTELFSNGDFSDGTTGWASDARSTASAPDYAIRLTVDVNDGNSMRLTQAISFTEDVPHAIRSVLHDGRGSSGLTAGVRMDDGTLVSSSIGTDRGLVVASMVPVDTSSTDQRILSLAPGAALAGDYMESSFASVCACALVDDGPNALTRSDEFDHADWTKTRVTISSTSETAPDGTSTADMIAEDGTASNTHFVQESATVAAAVADYTLACFLKADNRTWAQLSMDAGGSFPRAWFNLATGAVGTTNISGGNWADQRATITDAGNGWYYCTLTARKTSADTSLALVVAVAESDGDSTFSGLTQDSIVAWGASLAQSGVPVRYVQTVATADADGTSQTGGALHLKGLPASADGILLAGDFVQIPGIDQLVRATAPLNSDAAGLGYLQFEPPLRSSPANDAAVIDVDPLVRVMIDERQPRFTERPGGFLDVDLALAEDIVPA